MIEDSWKRDAACAQPADVDIFYPDKTGARAAKAAKAVCKDCPVREACLEVGLAEEYGVWGGLSVRERKKLAAKRRAERFRV